jgi:hypothetical protein
VFLSNECIEYFINSEYIRSIGGVEYYTKLKWTYEERKNLAGVHESENGGSNPPHGTKKISKKV